MIGAKDEKELLAVLVLVAKAAKLDIDFSIVTTDGVNKRYGFQSWNPLVDDGDALRLAVACNLRVATGQAEVPGHWRASASVYFLSADDEPDRLLATRYAIVAAAASIGALMA